MHVSPVVAISSGRGLVASNFPLDCPLATMATDVPRPAGEEVGGEANGAAADAHLGDEEKNKVEVRSSPLPLQHLSPSHARLLTFDLREYLACSCMYSFQR